MIWVLILELALTGQHVAIDIPTEAECRSSLSRLAAGEHMIVTTKDGIRLSVERGIACRPKTELMGGV